jgi:hypothetical protein
MINRLLPEQISKFWDVIKYAVEQSLPPTVGDHPDKMNRILGSMLCGKIDVWMSYTVNGEKRKLNGLVVTRFLYDDASDTKTLLLYCAYSYADERIAHEFWVEGYNAMVEYARANKCIRLIAYSDIPYLIEMANAIGAETRFHLISFPLKAVKI